MQSQSAAVAWKNFTQVYQIAHPDLPAVHFAADLSVAIAILNPNSLFPQLKTVRLAPEEQQQATTLHQSMEDSKRAVDEAQGNWEDFKHQLAHSRTISD